MSMVDHTPHRWCMASLLTTSLHSNNNNRRYCFWGYSKAEVKELVLERDWNALKYCHYSVVQYQIGLLNSASIVAGSIDPLNVTLFDYCIEIITISEVDHGTFSKIFPHNSTNPYANTSHRIINPSNPSRRRKTNKTPRNSAIQYHSKPKHQIPNQPKTTWARNPTKSRMAQVTTDLSSSERKRN